MRRLQIKELHENGGASYEYKSRAALRHRTSRPVNDLRRQRTVSVTRLCLDKNIYFDLYYVHIISTSRARCSHDVCIHASINFSLGQVHRFRLLLFAWCIREKSCDRVLLRSALTKKRVSWNSSIFSSFKLSIVCLCLSKI